MKKMYCYLLVVMTVICLSGCGKSTGGVSLSDYNLVIKERDKAQADLAELKENSVTKDDYDSVVAERDELKSRVEELEQAVVDDVNEEKEPETYEPGVYGSVHYIVAPVSVGDVYGHSWDIEKI